MGMMVASLLDGGNSPVSKILLNNAAAHEKEAAANRKLQGLHPSLAETHSQINYVHQQDHTCFRTTHMNLLLFHLTTPTIVARMGNRFLMH